MQTAEEMVGAEYMYFPPKLLVLGNMCGTSSLDVEGKYIMQLIVGKK
jgi:hypothetical protein